MNEKLIFHNSQMFMISLNSCFVQYTSWNEMIFSVRIKIYANSYTHQNVDAIHKIIMYAS